MPDALIEHADGGLWWPCSTHRHELLRRAKRIPQAARAAQVIAELAPRRGVCVQAGGHVGLWPRELARYFDRVITFEPDLANWMCLARNIWEPNVYPVRGVLGSEPGGKGLVRDKPFSGLFYVSGTGPIPTYRVDDLGLEELSALVLDVEGYELNAIEGAFDTIREYRPLVHMENLKWAEKRGEASSFEHVRELLADAGYGPPQRSPAVGADVYFLPVD